MKANVCSGLLLILVLTVLPSTAKELRTTIVYDDTATDLTSAREDAGQLWIMTADLKRATRFEVKPQGVCRDELCFPLPKAKHEAFIHKDAGNGNSSQTWFNITAFADLVHQPVAHDAARQPGILGYAQTSASSSLHCKRRISRCLTCRESRIGSLIFAERKSCWSHGQAGEGAALTCQAGRQFTSS